MTISTTYLPDVQGLPSKKNTWEKKRDRTGSTGARTRTSASKKQRTEVRAARGAVHSSQPPQRAAEAELEGDVGPVAPPARLVALGLGEEEERNKGTTLR